MRPPAGEVELIYVDSDSSDDSPCIASEAGARVIIVRPDRPTPALGRNAGWRASAAPFILFLDGDCVLHPDFVTRTLPEFEDPKIGIVFGRTRELHPNASVFHRVYDVHWWSPPVGAAEFCLGTALVRRSVLAAVKGYDPNLMAGEEPEICMRIRRLGYVILCVDLPMAAHDVAMTHWSQYWRRGERQGYAHAEVSQRLGKENSPALAARTRRTQIWGSVLVLLPMAAIANLIVTSSWLPLAIVAVILVALAAREAFSCRRKTRSVYTLLLFGIHSYLKEVPRLVGQLRYFYDRRTGRKTWIEYKTIRKEG
jgi:cellulose synthase/poly-beta-1,6-N-acetylglucosamine synthase-like glycosyltransferase